jgi:predicted nucleic acid-binding protein
VRLVPDTNIYCDYAEGVPSTIDTIAEFGKEIYMPVVDIAELTFGFMKGAKQEDNEKKLQQVIDQLQLICFILYQFCFFHFLALW